jgi:signal transduction histidine kinase
VELREAVDRLHREVVELQAGRRRLLLAADDERRRIERELHEGVQQHLVALAVNLQLAGELTDADPAAAKALVEELGRDVQQALDEAAQLARRIYPQLDAGGLVAALRSAAVVSGVRASVDVGVGAAGNYPPELAAAVYWCWLDVLEHSGDGASADVTVRNRGGALTFEVVCDGERSAAELEPLRDRVEALGGWLTIRSEPGRGTRVSGSLPLSG